MLWAKGKAKKEKCWQSVFICFVQLILEHHDFDLTPEYETGTGPVDFKISKGHKCRIIIEMKMSNSQFKKGLKDQLEKYKESAGIIEKAYFIYVDVETNPKKGDLTLFDIFALFAIVPKINTFKLFLFFIF